MACTVTRARFVVSGRVQGVGFRWNVCQAAASLSLTGWVRNVGNGDVELVACGDPAAIAELERLLWRGPALARVTQVRRFATQEQAPPDFTIR